MQRICGYFKVGWKHGLIGYWLLWNNFAEKKVLSV